MSTGGPARPLDALTSIKARLGVLVAVSVVAAALVGALGERVGVPLLLAIPVAVALALGVTQLLAAGMVAPLREMTAVAQRLARGDYSGRVRTQSADEVGRLAAAFNTMADDLATVDRERRDLVATVSHEIRTPLAALTAVLDNIVDGVVPADGPHLSEVLAQAERLGALVSDLLELSRLDAGTARLDLAPVRLRRLVEESVQQVTTAGPRASFDVQVPADLEAVADAMRLRQLVTNVVDNSARHCPAGERVVITAGATADGWWLEVSDLGPGVAMADRERAFERFGTLAGGQGGGTGLGLAIARWVATLHGGTLRFVEPAPGRPGARLRLEIPVPIPAQEAEMTVPAPPAAPAVPDAPSEQRPPYVPPGMPGLFGRFWPEEGDLPGLRVVVTAAAVGVLAGAVLTFDAAGLTWSLVLAAAGAAALVTARRRREPWVIACAAIALLLVLPVTLLDAWWIGTLAILVAAGVFLSGVTGARTLVGMVLAGVSWPLASLRGLPWFGRALRVAGTGGRVPAVTRTVAWSLLGLAVFGAIFASADALFASWVDTLVPNLTFGDLVARAFVGCAVFAMTLAAAYLALNPSHVDLTSTRRPEALRNRFEWLVPVLVVDLVFVVFLAAQTTAVFGGHAYVERTTGLTYAEYVHQGFGQLTLATALTLLVVWAASRRAGRTRADTWWLRGSLGLLCLMTLVVVASALSRMHVYQEAYGFTTLRLFVDVFEGWLGFVVLAVVVSGIAGWGRWLPRIALASGALAVLGLAAINPDAWVAERNIDRYEATGKLDADYLQSLSADAAPVIAERLPVDVAGCVLRQLRYNTLEAEAESGVLGWNLGRARAAEAVATIELAGPPGASGDGCAHVWARLGSQ